MKFLWKDFHTKWKEISVFEFEGISFKRDSVECWAVHAIDLGLRILAWERPPQNLEPPLLSKGGGGVSTGICSEYFDVLLSMENGNVMLSYFNKALAFHDFDPVQYWLAIKDTRLSINPDILSLWNLLKFLPFVNQLLCNCTSRRPFFSKMVSNLRVLEGIFETKLKDWFFLENF